MAHRDMNRSRFASAALRGRLASTLVLSEMNASQMEVES